MLEKLNQTDWSKLSHAYGPATDIPGQLRALVSGDNKAWDKAVRDLHGNIWHQGTVYEASAYAVPFLLEICRDEKLSDEKRVELLALIALVGNGTSYLEVHGRGYIEVGGRARVMTDSEQRDQLQRERAWVEAARSALRKGAAFYFELLRSKHSPTRLLAAYLLGLCQPHDVLVVETLANDGVPLE